MTMKVAVVPRASSQLGPHWAPPTASLVPESIPKKYLFPDSNSETVPGLSPLPKWNQDPNSKNLSPER